MTVMKINNLSPLDGLRGIAITAVFIFHMAEGGAFKGLPWLQDLMLTGWLGVDLFFAVSGFLITRSAINLLGRDNYYKTFYRNRARRILPAYYSILMVLIVAFGFLYRENQYFHVFSERLTCLFLMCTNIETALTSIALPFGLNHFWSLAVEVQIYLLWPVIVANLSRRRLLVFALGVAAFSFGYRVYVLTSTEDWVLIYFSTFTRLDSFAMGAAVFLLSEHTRRRLISYTLIAGGICGGVATAFLNSGIPFNNPWASVFGITFAAFFSSGVVLIVVTENSKILIHALTNKYVMGLGTISYSFYIVHYPIMQSRYFWMPGVGTAVFGRTIQQDVLMGAILVAACLFVSFLSYQFLEKPFLAKKPKADFA